MNRRQLFKKIAFTAFLICLMMSSPVHAQDMGLVDLLTGRLGITKNQASGGAGSIFQLAKQNLNSARLNMKNRR